MNLLDDILNDMEEPRTVVWAPTYGAAALQHYKPRSHCSVDIHILGLSGWETYQHRCGRKHYGIVPCILTYIHCDNKLACVQ